MRTSKQLIATASLIAGVAGVIPGTGAAALASTNQPVLGSAKSIPHAKGWGTAAPQTVSSGTDRAARITQIHWQHWGKSAATGWGMTSLPKQTGGYYPGLYRVQLRATQIAYDAGQRARAYMVLEAREPLKPGAAMSPWFQWVGQQEMCN